MNLDIDFGIMRPAGFYNQYLMERARDVADIEKYSGWLHISFCPICKTENSKNKIQYKTEFGNYIHCSVCSALYLDKVAKEQNTGQYTNEGLDVALVSSGEDKRDYRKERFGNERIKILERFSKRPLNTLSILDVGCAAGFFIDVAKPHFKEVFGLETSLSLARYTEKKTGCGIYTEQLSLVKRSFDVITMFDVIEHVNDPVGFLSDAINLLNENGIVLCYTPNHKSVGFEVLGDQNTHITPCHVVLFCKETVKFIEKTLNTPVIFYETQGMDIFDISAYQRDINRICPHEKICHERMNADQRLINKSERANSLRFVIRKGEE